MRCSQCEKWNPDGASFCMRCGSKLSLVCPQCGTDLPPDPDARFCFVCGGEIAAEVDVQASGSSDAVAERLHRLVPREYADRLQATRGRLSRERRMVTILFSDIKSSTALAEELDPEDWLGDHGWRL